MSPLRVLVFGDQAVEKLPSIRRLTQLSKSSPLLRRFLREAVDVIQHELTQVRPAERQLFKSLGSILDLAESAVHDEPNEVVSGVLVCIERLGELILYAEMDNSILHSSQSNIRILGFCTGLLPAAVAALANNLGDLLTLGREIVAVAFRLGIELARRSNLVDEKPGFWAMTIIGVASKELQSAIDRFNMTESLPIPRRAYLGVTSRTWSTVFGPPGIIEKFSKSSPALELAPKTTMGVATAVHATHLPSVNLDHVLGTSSLLLRSTTSMTPLLSTSTCVHIDAKNLRELLYAIVGDIAQNPLRMEPTIQAAMASVDQSESVELVAVGPSPHVTMIQRLFESNGYKVGIAKPAGSLPTPENTRSGSDLVAIVGMSCRFPGGNDLAEFWETLVQGKALHQQIPSDRFDLEEFYDPSGTLKNSTATPYGCFLDNPGEFDHRLFNVSPREAIQMDPLMRLLLLTSYEALEVAGYSRNGSISTAGDRIATYFGQTADDWRHINEQQGIDIYYIPGIIRAFAPGRVHNYFKWEGPYYSLDTACASSSTAAHLACNALKSRECDTALVGGGQILASPYAFSALSHGGFLSTSGGCKTFDERADGYCRGEGVGVVILKRLEDAIADNDNIHAVIRATARNYSAEASSITQPHGETQERLFRKILQDASVDPNEIGFVEMHGTGTQAGDTVEAGSVANVFGPGRPKNNPLMIGAAKANIGHSEAAAGVASLIKLVLMLRYGTIPPQPGSPIIINPKLPQLDKFNIRIAEKASDFVALRKGSTRKALLNNFDAAGGNTCLLIEDAPAAKEKAQDLRTFHVITCSGRTPLALKGNKTRLLNYVISHPDARLCDIAYTTTARRQHTILRSAFTAQTREDLIKQLREDLEQTEKDKSSPKSHSGSTVFVFTGQGSQYPGMARQLFETSPRFRELILSYQQICTSQNLASFIDLIANEEMDISSASTVQIQLAIVALEIALAKLWQSWGVKSTAVIGHSLGEYSALCISGVLSVSDTLYLVGRRASLMQEKCEANTYSMLAVVSSSETVQERLERYSTCHISCINSPEATVVSGMADEIKSLENSLDRDQIRSILLTVPYGFHSSQVEPILEDFKTSANGVNFGEPSIPIISTTIGQSAKDKFDAAHLVRHARDTVDFEGALHEAKTRGLITDDSLILECGPQPVCLGLVRSTLDIDASRLLPGLRAGEDVWRLISNSLKAAYLSHIPIDWHDFHAPFLSCLSLLQLPTYSFDLKTFWEPFKRDFKAQLPAPVLSLPVSTFSTTCLQRVEQEVFEADHSSVTFVSNTAEHKLYEVIQGHLVNGLALCPASVFFDMAFTAAKYIYFKARPDAGVPQMEMRSLEIQRPLVVSSPPNQQQIMKVTAVVAQEGTTIDIVFEATEEGVTSSLGSAQVVFHESEQWSPELSRSIRPIQKRMLALKGAGITIEGYKMRKAMIYKLFANVVDYHSSYQALDEVFIADDSDGEALGNLQLRPVNQLGSFTYNPYWTDAIVHIAGWALNGSLTKPDNIAYIADAIESIRIKGELREGRQYQCYTDTRKGENDSVYVGDVYLFDEDSLIALCSGIKFRKMTKDLFSMVCGYHGSAPSQPSPMNKSQKAPVTTTSKKSRGNIAPEIQVHPVQPTISPTPPSSDVEEGTSLMDQFLRLVMLKTGCSIDEIDSSAHFADLGIDSLMSISIIAAMKREVGVVLPASFFMNFPTIAEAQVGLEEYEQSKPAPQKATKLSVPKPEPVILTPDESDQSEDEPDSTGLAQALFAVIAQQTGVEAEDFEPASKFADMGVDSLMAIAITRTFQRETGITLPASFFSNNATVEEAEAELSASDWTTAPVTKPAKSGSPLKVAALPQPPATSLKKREQPNGIMKKQEQSNSIMKNQEQPNGIMKKQEQPNSIIKKQEQPNSMIKKQEQPNGIIKTRELPEQRPKAVVKQQVVPKEAPKTLPEPPSAINGSTNQIVHTQTAELDYLDAADADDEPFSNIVLIQGRRSSTERPLFMIADGAGAATAYIHLPPLAEGRHVYALESPFLSNPEKYPRGIPIPETAVMYAAAIRKVQAKGPYMLGGWSAGGVYAFETARLLLSEGEEVLNLIIIDMRVPKEVPDAIEPTMELIKQTGLGRLFEYTPKKQHDHLLAALKALLRYRPKPMDPGNLPKSILLVWATLGSAPTDSAAAKEVNAPWSEADMGQEGGGKEHAIDAIKSWFYGRRKTFGPNGWDRLVGEKNIYCKTIEADHFTIVAPPKVKLLGQYIQEAIDSSN